MEENYWMLYGMCIYEVVIISEKFSVELLGCWVWV